MSTSDPDADPTREEYFGHRHVTEIGGQGQRFGAALRELWLYRDLLALLIQRDVSIRYKQSVVGIAWAFLQPLILMTIFTIVFGRFAKLPSDGVPYPLFVVCGLLPWQYFSRSLAGSSGSLVGSTQLVTKVYFPRLIMPLSKTAAGLVDLAIAFVLVAILLAWYRIMPGWEILLLPVFILLALFAALAMGLWLTALNVRYRDVGLIVPFVIQIWMYCSPIAYSISLVPEKWRWLYSLNPMVGVAGGFRWALLGNAPPEINSLLISTGIVLLLLGGGLAYFRRAERNFADII